MRFQPQPASPPPRQTRKRGGGGGINYSRLRKGLIVEWNSASSSRLQTRDPAIGVVHRGHDLIRSRGFFAGRAYVPFREMLDLWENFTLPTARRFAELRSHFLIAALGVKTIETG